MKLSKSTYSIPFPLNDVEITKVEEITQPQHPLYTGKWMQIGTSEFSMFVKDVGAFYAGGGDKIEYAPHEKSDLASLELYMNGSVFGAILHQRRILPLHGSSFIFNGSGVMFCGDSGAGKSSLTTSFCINGADFLTDDVTPIIFENDEPHIWPKSGKIKLWEDSLLQLRKKKNELTKIRPEDEKYYFPVQTRQIDAFPLHYIFILQIKDVDDVSFERVEKAEAFSYLHREIYRREYLIAMKEAESAYLEQVSRICNQAKVFRVERPNAIPITTMQERVESFLSGND